MVADLPAGCHNLHTAAGLPADYRNLRTAADIPADCRNLRTAADILADCHSLHTAAGIPADCHSPHTAAGIPAGCHSLRMAAGLPAGYHSLHMAIGFADHINSYYSRPYSVSSLCFSNTLPRMHAHLIFLLFYLSLPHPIHTLEDVLFFVPQSLQYHTDTAFDRGVLAAAAAARFILPLLFLP